MIDVTTLSSISRVIKIGWVGGGLGGGGKSISQHCLRNPSGDEVLVQISKLRRRTKGSSVQINHVDVK